MFLLLFTAVTYFYFNWRYFILVNSMGYLSHRRTSIILLSFMVNYLFFIVCSIMEFSLIANWFLFAFLLFFETLIYNKGNKRFALFCTLMGIIFGLAVNIFCRSVFAIFLNQPMQSFDNNTIHIGNLKGIPVLLGFLLAGMVLQYMEFKFIKKRIRLILNHPRHQAFIIEIMIGLFFYLFLNLLLYSTPINNILLKVWSIKSCLFSIVGFYIGMRYTKRICELEDYRDENRRIERDLKKSMKEEELLKKEASVDMLTGLYNRQSAEEIIISSIKKDFNFTICFLDLDGLKKVNDKYGHEEGDRYITTVVEQMKSMCRSNTDKLFRYGGDEFLALFLETPAKVVCERAEMINKKLGSIKKTEMFDYPLSVSYGVAESSEFSDWQKLIETADARMYRQKQVRQIERK